MLALLQRLNRERAITIVLVTHERDIAACASRVVTMRDGRIVSDVVQDAPLDARRELEKLQAPDEGAAGDASRAHSDAGGAAGVASRPIPAGAYAGMSVAGAVAALAAYAYFLLAWGAAPVTSAWSAVLAGEIGAALLGSRSMRRRLGAPASSDQRARVAVVRTVVTITVVAAVVLGLSFWPLFAPGRVTRRGSSPRRGAGRRG